MVVAAVISAATAQQGGRRGGQPQGGSQVHREVREEEVARNNLVAELEVKQVENLVKKRKKADRKKAREAEEEEHNQQGDREDRKVEDKSSVVEVFLAFIKNHDKIKMNIILIFSVVSVTCKTCGYTVGYFIARLLK